MDIKVITVGKPTLSWARSAVEDYLGRLRKTARVEWLPLRGRQATDAGMLEASEGCLRVVLDERGQAWRSVELARWLEARELAAVRRVAFLIGGAEGHGEVVRSAAEVCWSLSPLTLQHEVALVVMLEQLYRAGTIRRGEPYHREG
ncbi:MAG: 23S rRNA (pseudouridine(1915)-N(3))-methyltransferase RlmH [Verrucomicrobiales bacterium]|nr:23S rRNA (pseudouridine(1915)-N(3))-methyltransferase RlmH [Verrucomicrobiales bacterium]